MPTITAPEDDMEGLYPGEEAAEPEAAAEEEMPEGEAPETIDEEEADTGTGLLSNKILSPDGSPLKEGDTITVTVVKNYGDESEVKVSKAAIKSPETMASAESELDQMSAEGE